MRIIEFAEKSKTNADNAKSDIKTASDRLTQICANEVKVSYIYAKRPAEARSDNLHCLKEPFDARRDEIVSTSYMSGVRKWYRATKALEKRFDEAYEKALAFNYVANEIKAQWTKDGVVSTAPADPAAGNDGQASGASAAVKGTPLIFSDKLELIQPAIEQERKGCPDNKNITGCGILDCKKKSNVDYKVCKTSPDDRFVQLTEDRLQR